MFVFDNYLPKPRVQYVSPHAELSITIDICLLCKQSLIITDHLTMMYAAQININKRNGKLFNNVQLALINCRI